MIQAIVVNTTDSFFTAVLAYYSLIIIAGIPSWLMQKKYRVFLFHNLPENALLVMFVVCCPTAKNLLPRTAGISTALLPPSMG